MHPYVRRFRARAFSDGSTTPRVVHTFIFSATRVTNVTRRKIRTAQKSDDGSLKLRVVCHKQFLCRRNTHDTRSRNRRHKSTPFSGARFRRRFFVPHSE